MRKKIIIMGATSGIGRALAEEFIRAGWLVGVAGRRFEKLQQIAQKAPERVFYQPIDITQENADNLLLKFIQQLGGIDYYLHVAGIGFQNLELQQSTELETIQTNITGFTRMIDTAFNYMKTNGGGHIGVISSVAGTKGLGAAPAYSATKRFQNTYIEALAQLSNMKKLGITFSDIRPGFVRTALLNEQTHYPLLMTVEMVTPIIFKALIQKRRIKIVDWRYALIVFGWRLLPGFIWEKIKVKS